ncbi:hypothetical protein [Streptomyces sp. NPDC048639]|uniref:hypothetical protein n=1 Tax=Streptomyces sp. NPDC048639 TaxID=3365581 RepID=UPI00371DAAE9
MPVIRCTRPTLIHVLGFRPGEVLGLTGDNVDMDAGEGHGALRSSALQQPLVGDEAGTEASTATLPLPQSCLTALQLRRKSREASAQSAGELWTDSDFVFTTRHATPIGPRDFLHNTTKSLTDLSVRDSELLWT